MQIKCATHFLHQTVKYSQHFLQVDINDHIIQFATLSPQCDRAAPAPGVNARW